MEYLDGFEEFVEPATERKITPPALIINGAPVAFFSSNAVYPSHWFSPTIGAHRAIRYKAKIKPGLRYRSVHPHLFSRPTTSVNTVTKLDANGEGWYYENEYSAKYGFECHAYFSDAGLEPYEHSNMWNTNYLILAD